MKGHRRSSIHFFYSRTSPFWYLCSRDSSIHQGTQNLAQACNNVLFVTSIKDTSIQEKGTLFLSQKTWVINLHSEDTINSIQKVTITTKIVNKFKCSLVAMMTAFKTWINSHWLKLMYTQHPRDKLVMSFYTVDSW